MQLLNFVNVWFSLFINVSCRGRGVPILLNTLKLTVADDDKGTKLNQFIYSLTDPHVSKEISFMALNKV